MQTRWAARPAQVPATIALLVVFVSTAAVGVWTAYNRTSALEKFGLILVGFLLVLAMAWFGNRNRATTLNVACLVCAGIAVLLSLGYFVHIITDTDLVASSLMLLLPLSASGLAVSFMQGHLGRAAGISLVLVVGLAALALSPERSAWVGLLAGCAGAALWIWRFHIVQSRFGRRWIDTVVFLIVAAAVTVYLTILFTRSLDSALNHLPFNGRLMSRVMLWRDTLPLIQDYLITGSGLSSTAMIYSTYLYLLHVPYIHHAHNLYLQIAVEQGLLGLTVFCATGGIVIWSMARLYPHASSRLRAHIVGVIAACTALFVYGLFDSEIYVTFAAPIMFIPVGFALAAQGGQHGTRSWAAGLRRGTLHAGAGVFFTAIIILLTAGWIRWVGGPGVLMANLGAVSQTRAELSVYTWPEWPIQDAVRRDNVVDLFAAETYYAGALDLDPENVTAHRRLGQIALSQGDYTKAHDYLVIAHRLAPTHPATRQMLGEVYAVTGDTTHALGLWQDLDMSHGQLDARQWWYRYLGATAEAEQIAQVLGLLRG